MTRQARRVRAKYALMKYQEILGHEAKLISQFTDIIADLLHLAHHEGYDIADVLETAEILFQESVGDEDDN